MRIEWLLGVAVALSAAGCVLGEHGLCPPDGGDAASFDPALLGDWVPERPAGRPGVPGEFVRVGRLREGSKTYVSSDMVPRDGVAAVALGRSLSFHLVAIGDARYLDLFETGPREGARPDHLVARIEVDGATVTIRPLDPDYLAAHPEAPASSSAGRAPFATAPAVRITASGAAIVAFLAQHGRDPAAWDEPLRLTRRR